MPLRFALSRRGLRSPRVAALSVLAAVLTLTSFAYAAPPAAAPSRPNIIFILADDLGYGELGCYGQTKIQTPHLDRLAAEGMRFTQFYAGSTVCAPSRSVLMTGLHTGHTRVRGNAGGKVRRAQMLKESDLTIAEALQSAGYRTGLVGKWGLGMPGDEGVPTKQGFDDFFGFLSQHHAHNHFPDFLFRNEERVLLPNEVKPVGEDGGGYATKRVQYAGDLFAAEALRFLDRAPKSPFFLYLALTVPHANNERSRALGDGQEVPDYGPYADKDWSPQHKGQAAMITRMDAQIGDLMARLKKLGLDENTLVLFSSDNGPHKEGGNDPQFFHASGPLTGLKRSLTEGGIRVPFLARWPGKIKPGSVSDHVGYFGDFFATAVELAGIENPAEITAKLDSLSLAPTLLGQPEKQRRHDYLYWEFYEGGVSQAVLLEGRYKGIRLKNPAAPIQLFDLQTDLAEQHNLAQRDPERVARVAELMRAAHVDNEHWKLPQ